MDNFKEALVKAVVFRDTFDANGTATEEQRNEIESLLKKVGLTYEVIVSTNVALEDVIKL